MSVQNVKHTYFNIFRFMQASARRTVFSLGRAGKKSLGLHAATKGFLIQISELFKTQRQRQVIANHNWHLHFGGEWGTYGGKLLK